MVELNLVLGQLLLMYQPEQFGEGSFDKGIFFKIPIYGGLFDYKWRPLTKDPAAPLLRKHTLHDLLVKFRPLD